MQPHQKDQLVKHEHNQVDNVKVTKMRIHIKFRVSTVHPRERNNALQCPN